MPYQGNDSYPDGKPFIRYPGTRDRLPLISILLPVIGFFSLLIICSIFKPLRQTEALTLCAIYTAPLWIWFSIWTCFFSKGGEKLNFSSRIVAVMLCAIGASCLCSSLYLTLNAKLDFKHETTVQVSNLHEYVTYSKNGQPYYHISGQSPIKQKLFFDIDDGRETIIVTHKEFYFFDTDTARLDLTYKPGFLGLPWIVSAHLDALSNSFSPK